MTSRVCTNGLCGATSSSEWKKGWSLRSGEIARLCHKCGTAYEQLVFCDIFHSKDSGWRECASCGKHLHCGCIASSSLFELLDSGGVNCISCLKSGLHSISSDEKPKEFHHSTENIGETRSISMDNQLNGLTHDEQNQSSSTAAADGHKHVVLSCNDDTNGFIAQLKLENNLPPSVQGSTYSSTLNLEPLGSSQNVKSDIDKEKMGLKDLCETRVQTNLTISLPAPSGITNPFPDAVTDDKDTIKTISSFQHGSRYCHLLPKPPNSVVADSFETSINSASQIRAARPPTEGRVKCHLLPRYWPRITEEELLQITGDSNSTVVPLFEKVLSASDAGRIGRLVLPKACAEAYFPTISQPEGLPLRIQDVKGKEWVFQFRFWPNNNSRMYVLEGVTPCIQSMQLQAGDTVTFSRMDPEGKLLMGFRKASNTTPIQETHLSAIRNRTFSSEPFFSGVIESLPIMSGYPALLRSLKGSMEPHLTTSSEQLNSANGDSNWNIAEKHRVKTRDGSVPLSLLVPERKRSRNIGSKSKRLLIDSQDALELKLTWEEMQDMLRPPPTAKPTSVTVEDQVFEEYEEPPVFGKRSIFTVRLSGEHEQWVQCDSCFKWRRIPADYLLPPNWRCVDNVWDQSRCSCASPDELSPRELQNLLKVNNDLKRRRCATKRKPTHEHESAILVTPTNAPVVGDDTSDYGDTSVATTTKHPRHRPGCSCIVCIQPPSGKGKHKPTCTCNVCMTVKRRFKTLMMRNKKRQSEREAEIAQRNQFVWGRREETDVYRSSQPVVLRHDPIQNEAGFGLELEYGDRKNNHPQLAAESGKGLLDLNCQSQREDLCIGSTRVSMMSLLQEANLPLEAYLKQNGLASLMCEQQASSGSHLVQQATGESMERLHEDQHQQEEVDEELCVAADKIPNDHR